VGPACSILVDGLDATRQKFSTVSISQTERSGCGIVNVSGESAVRMSLKIAQDRFDETVVGGDCHSVTLELKAGFYDDDFLPGGGGRGR
jgi:hypothetical protein